MCKDLNSFPFLRKVHNEKKYSTSMLRHSLCTQPNCRYQPHISYFHLTCDLLCSSLPSRYGWHGKRRNCLHRRGNSAQCNINIFPRNRMNGRDALCMLFHEGSCLLDSLHLLLSFDMQAVYSFLPVVCKSLFSVRQKSHN